MKLTASDRKSLIRLAASLPKGSAERRAILAGLAGLKTARRRTPGVEVVIDRVSLKTSFSARIYGKRSAESRKKAKADAEAAK